MQSTILFLVLAFSAPAVMNGSERRIRFQEYGQAPNAAAEPSLTIFQKYQAREVNEPQSIDDEQFEDQPQNNLRKMVGNKTKYREKPAVMFDSPPTKAFESSPESDIDESEVVDPYGWMKTRTSGGEQSAKQPIGDKPSGAAKLSHSITRTVTNTKHTVTEGLGKLGHLIGVKPKSKEAIARPPSFNGAIPSPYASSPRAKPEKKSERTEVERKPSQQVAKRGSSKEVKNFYSLPKKKSTKEMKNFEHPDIKSKSSRHQTAEETSSRAKSRHFIEHDENGLTNNFGMPYFAKLEPEMTTTELNAGFADLLRKSSQNRSKAINPSPPPSRPPSPPRTSSPARSLPPSSSFERTTSRDSDEDTETMSTDSEFSEYVKKRACVDLIETLSKCQTPVPESKTVVQVPSVYHGPSILTQAERYAVFEELDTESHPRLTGVESEDEDDSPLSKQGILKPADINSKYNDILRQKTLRSQVHERPPSPPPPSDHE